MKTKEISFRPIIFSSVREFAKFQETKTAGEEIELIDAQKRQLRELFLINRPAPKDRGAYVYYPWLKLVVKTVGPEDYFHLKTNRNQDLITAEEQKILSNYRVAVLGMSVGSNIAFILTQAGISRKIILADYDELDTTNLNRILAGVHQIGLNKAVLAARKIYEDNPFAEATIWPTGVSVKNLRAALERREIDCLVEEIDNIQMKIAVRRLAREFRIPVIMIIDNGDGIVLQIERYDLGYDKIFERDDDYWKKKLGTGPLEKVVVAEIIMNDMIGGVNKLDPRMAASVKRTLADELVSWSQLGSAALLGGVAVTTAIKKIVRGEEKRPFVRAYIRPDF